jgi:hypothetical protein
MFDYLMGGGGGGGGATSPLEPALPLLVLVVMVWEEPPQPIRAVASRPRMTARENFFTRVSLMRSYRGGEAKDSVQASSPGESPRRENADGETLAGQFMVATAPSFMPDT